MSTAPLLIGLSAKARHGKDTFYEALKLVYGDDVRRLAFADGVRQEARAAGVWDGLVPYTEQGRTVLQQVGMARRQENPNYWILKAFHTMAAENLSGHGPRIWVMTDVRFRNEAEAVLGAGGIMLRIERVNADWSTFDNGMTMAQRAHPSETELDDYVFSSRLINVHGSIDVFRADVMDAVHHLLMDRARKSP